MSEKLRAYMHATQEGRDLIRGFGGVENFQEKFITEQMWCIRQGDSEKEAFDKVKQYMEEELESYRGRIEEAYATIVEADGGKSLAEFVTSFTPKSRLDNDKKTQLPSSALRAGPIDVAFMKALDDLGFIKAMDEENKARPLAKGEEGEEEEETEERL